MMVLPNELTIVFAGTRNTSIFSKITVSSYAVPKVVESWNRKSLVLPLRVKAPVVASRVKLPALPSE